MLPGTWPRHVLGIGKGRLLERSLAFRLVEHGVDRRRERGRVSKRDEESAVICEGFPSVQIGRGDDRLSRAKRICKGPAGDLLWVEVWRDVDVACQQQLDDVPLSHVFIDEGNVVLKSKALDSLDQLISIPLAIDATQLRMCLSRDQVKGG